MIILPHVHVQISAKTAAEMVLIQADDVKEETGYRKNQHGVRI